MPRKTEIICDGCGENDIEITPAMVEAGIAILSNYDCEWDGIETTVAAIYRAMAQKSPRRP